jgi:hypothetical protein
MAIVPNEPGSPDKDPGESKGLNLVSSDSQAEDKEPTQPIMRGRGGGPKTMNGKKASSKNSTSHGIMSPSPSAAGERQQDFDAFLEGFREDLGPVGQYEGEMVHDLASLWWRLRRITRAEVAYIDARYAAIDDPDPLLELPGHKSPADRHFEETFCNLGMALELLAALPKMDDSAVVDFDGFMHLDGIIRWLRPPDVSFEKVQVEFDERDLLKKRAVTRYLFACARLIMGSLFGFENYIRETAELVLAERESRARSVRLRRQRRELDAVLPSPDQLATLTKYEAHLRRSITKTTNHLEIAQRQRSGDSPPPPQRLEITVDVDEGA